LHAVSLATAAVLTGIAVLIATGLRYLPPLRQPSDGQMTAQVDGSQRLSIRGGGS
jgi:hypothetical protein